MLQKAKLTLLFTTIAMVVSLSSVIAADKDITSNIKGNNPAFDRKKLPAVKVDRPPKINGNLDDPIWQKAYIATDFIQYSPFSGTKSGFKTEVKILYDNSALYIGAMMYDPSPDSIYKELGERDADFTLNADQFSVDISPYNDGINGVTFKISVSGVQSDRPPRSRMRHRGGGDTWDAVWESKTAITENGWIAELKIPYSALRFPKDSLQTWGINFWREVRRNREQSSWNYVDREIGTTFNHLGKLTGISNIEPPLRLSLTPYVSAYLEKFNSDPVGSSYNGGLDLKYGINESFTLDATLVPDFGQVRSDDQVLNLTPYEVKYNEKRPFFMEGVELFNKGGIFYSRRIGSRPKGYYDVWDNLQENEDVVANPSEAGLINATKISGRTKSGLGIGVFNAMTNSMYATIGDTLTDDTRTVLTDPFTNYNMIVLDQSLANNSYIAVANTNVRRNAEKNENFYTANVTATDFLIQDKSRFYSINGQAKLSQKLYDNDPTDFGHAYELRIGKTGGSFRLQYNLEASSDSYDPNDMGYMRRNNEFENEIQVSYNIYTPFWKILSNRNSLSYNYNMLYKPRVFTSSGIEFSSFTTFKNYMSLSLRGEYKPSGEDDYYEPRIDGWFYHRGKELRVMSWFDTDRRKKFSTNARFSYTKIWSDYDQDEFTFSVRPSVKFSDRFSMQYDFELRKKLNDIGYVNSNDTDTIYFGNRDNTTIENTIESGFIFTANSYISIRLRHYWSRADYNDEYYILNDDGSLSDIAYGENHDYNYNAFNIDLVYTWRFAPGSELSVVWKNSIYEGSDQIYYDFRENVNNMFAADKTNSLSLKVLYYLDYHYLKKRG